MTWKTALLKSGLPFEFFVARTLENSGYLSIAEFPYIRTNLNGNEVEFSCDLEGMKACSGRIMFEEAMSEDDVECVDFNVEINILVECKFTQNPKTEWVFSPSNLDADVNFTSFLDFSTDLYVSDPVPRAKPRPIQHCVKGTTLFPNGGENYDSRENTIQEGLSQLRFGMPAMIRRDMEIVTDLIGMWNQFNVYHSILVTSSPMRVLNKDITLTSVLASGSIDEISKPVDVVQLRSRIGPDLNRHISRQLELVDVELVRESDERARIKNVHLRKVNARFSRIRALRHSMETAAQLVTVVTFEYLPTLLASIEADALKIKERVKHLGSSTDSPRLKALGPANPPPV